MLPSMANFASICWEQNRLDEAEKIDLEGDSQDQARGRPSRHADEHNKPGLYLEKSRPSCCRLSPRGELWPSSARSSWMNLGRKPVARFRTTARKAWDLAAAIFSSSRFITPQQQNRPHEHTLSAAADIWIPSAFEPEPELANPCVPFQSTSA